MTIDDARRALPGWTVLGGGTGSFFEAREPNYQATGIILHADGADELIERCRAFVAVVEAAAGRPVPRTGAAERALQALPRIPPSTELGAPKVTPHARAVATARGYTGDVCASCGSLSMRRSGVCLVCDACGTTTGCS